MSMLLLGLALFFAAHSVSIVNEPWRNRMVARIGTWPWKGLYALVSIIGLVLMGWGYGLARQQPVIIYTTPMWLGPLALVMLAPVFPLFFAAYLPGRIQATIRHPMLIGTLLWAAAHLLVNGSLADVLLFGTFLVWAAADRRSMRHRVQRRIPQLPPSKANDLIALTAGLALYLAFIFALHDWLIGVPALAWQTP